MTIGGIVRSAPFLSSIRAGRESSVDTLLPFRGNGPEWVEDLLVGPVDIAIVPAKRTLTDPLWGRPRAHLLLVAVKGTVRGQQQEGLIG